MVQHVLVDDEEQRTKKRRIKQVHLAFRHVRHLVERSGTLTRCTVTSAEVHVDLKQEASRVTMSLQVIFAEIMPKLSRYSTGWRSYTCCCELIMM